MLTLVDGTLRIRLAFDRIAPPAANGPALPYNRILGTETSISVVALAKFLDDTKTLLATQEIEELSNYLAANPTAGDVIPHTGGARKARWAAKGKGKRGGVRVVYLHVTIKQRIFLLRCYAKNVQTDLSAAEKKAVRNLINEIKGR